MKIRVKITEASNVQTNSDEIRRDIRRKKMEEYLKW